jgi:hypothetical protein
MRDNNGQVLCGVVNNALYVRQVNCEGVRVFDPDDEKRTLAGLGSLPVNGPDGKPQLIGVLALNNRDFGTLTGTPPRNVVPEPKRGEKPEDAPAPEATAPPAN